LGAGDGLIWYPVFGIATARSLDLEGCMGLPFGPAHTLLHLELEDQEGVTILKLSDSIIGQMGTLWRKHEARWLETVVRNRT
jgi:hypothetical protein